MAVTFNTGSGSPFNVAVVSKNTIYHQRTPHIDYCNSQTSGGGFPNLGFSGGDLFGNILTAGGLMSDQKLSGLRRLPTG